MNPDILQHIILGIIQGITEWLPLSSEGMIVLVKTNFFPDASSLADLIKTALFLHLGTFFAALLYFRKDVSQLIRTIFSYKKSEDSSRKLLSFIIASAIISGIIGYVILTFISGAEEKIAVTGKAITLFVGFLLLGTASIQLRARSIGCKDSSKLSRIDSLLLGIGQGLSALPGISRSGITASLLLLRNFDKKEALRISFLMSLPIVFAGNILLNFSAFSSINFASILGLTASFVFGLATIHGMMKLAEKINFGWFVLVIALLMIISGLFL
ncbi:undecaprenyl-diphosphate phosphatase [Candidatus Pacearchaeota archaeon]|nr:undecaprenyl-diphosphate phosphatase [Candidatus Pacearchaeota archaeon]